MEIDFKTNGIVESVEATSKYRPLEKGDEQARQAGINGEYKKPLIINVNDRTGPDGEADGHVDFRA